MECQPHTTLSGCSSFCINRKIGAKEKALTKAIPPKRTSCGKCELRRTQGSPPSDGYMSKTVQCFEDFALFYANQSVRNARPNFYLLNLTSLSWYPLNLMLSHHFPDGKISLQKCGEEMVYLHGDCNLSNCIERTHLYQIDVEPLSALVRQKRRTKSLNILNFANFSIAEPENKKPSRMSAEGSPTRDVDAASPTTPTSATSKSSAHYLSRFQKKTEAKRRHSNKSSTTSMNSQEVLADTQPLKRSHSSSSLHWSADMVELAPQSLHSQLKLAKDMGYSEDVVLAALESQAKNKDGMYVPFESTNAMLDILNQAALRKSTASPLPNTAVNGKNDSSSYKTNRSSPKNVPRSLSFHGGSLSLSNPRGDELSRLLRTFEAEKARDLEAAESDMALLKTRIHDLERINDQYQQNERELRDCIHELRQRNESLISDFEKSENERIQLSQTIVELQALTDRLTLENLRNEHQAKDQKELAEHRKKQHDQQVSAMEESIRTLTEKCNSLSADLKDKEKQLVEKCKRIQEIEDRNSQLQPETLLEKIMNEYRLKRIEEERRKEENELFNRKISKYHEQLLASFPRLEEQRRRLEVEKERAVEEGEQLRREISRLREKTCAECCICLATKPSVLFLPCRHMVVCDSCHAESTISECPTCRSRVGDSMKVFS